MPPSGSWAEIPLLPAPRRINPARPARALPPQGYRIAISRGRVRIEAPDEAGRFYARQTLRQLRAARGRRIPDGVIEDWPDYPVRGVMLDISRDKVPKMETLFGLVDLLASLKINHLQLYMEHTFAYRDHRDVWRRASPMTAAQIRALDRYCRARFIELAPNQNTFGHLHRWLKLPRYRHLAECPDGYVTPWSERRSDPFSLNPCDPRSLKLVRELLTELVPNFRSRFVNVGCDETFDLGQGRSRTACRRRGKGRVYLDYLLAVHAITQKLGRRMMFWGDIILKYPDLIPKLPRDAVALVWGYEADHPFDTQCRAFAKAGLEFWVCPGTSTWNSIAGRADNMLANVRNAAASGLKHGARGFLLTDWGDGGHWHPLPFSYPGYAAGAALSWCLRAHRGTDWAAALDRHVFRAVSGSPGRIVLDLGNAYKIPGRRLHNASVLFRLLHQNDIAALRAEISARRLARAAEFIAKTLRPAKMKRADAGLVMAELATAAAMLELACARGLGDEGRDFAACVRKVIRVFRTVWLARNRPGGLPESLARLRARLRP